jgi:predicted transposase YbfD/YdcC
VTEVIDDFEDWVPATSQWWHVKTLIRVRATREDAISGKKEFANRYYFSSRELSAEQAGEAVRTHWSVENNLHWVLDVSFGQDGCQVRTQNAAENLATVRQFALNLIRSYSGDTYSIPRRRRLCDYDPDYREQLLAQTAGL